MPSAIRVSLRSAGARNLGSFPPIASAADPCRSRLRYTIPPMIEPGTPAPDFELANQDGETVARYDLLTMSARAAG